MDSIQTSLESESRAKMEALRIKKKLETDINELEIGLDHSNKANAEAHKSIKRYQCQLREFEQTIDKERGQRQVNHLRHAYQLSPYNQANATVLRKERSLSQI